MRENPAQVQQHPNPSNTRHQPPQRGNFNTLCEVRNSDSNPDGRIVPSGIRGCPHEIHGIGLPSVQFYLSSMWLRLQVGVVTNLFMNSTWLTSDTGHQTPDTRHRKFQDRDVLGFNSFSIFQIFWDFLKMKKSKTLSKLNETGQY